MPKKPQTSLQRQANSLYIGNLVNQGAVSSFLGKIGGVKDRSGFDCPTLEEFEKTYLGGYTPHKHQQILANQIDTRYVAVCAGRRSGKTYGVAREFMRRVYRDVERKKKAGLTWQGSSKLQTVKPFCHYWIAAPTHAMCVVPQREIMEIIGGVDSDLVLEHNATTRSLWLRGGVCIEFKSGEIPTNLVGVSLDGYWDDESARQKKDVWNGNVRPALTDKQGWALFSTTPRGKNWFYDDVWRLADRSSSLYSSEYFALTFFTADNTAVPWLVEEAEKARLTMPRALYLRDYEASFDAFEGKIFESFLDDETHVVHSLPRLVNKWGGADWGYSNPGTLIQVGTDRFGNIFVYHEDYERALTVTPPPNDSTADCWVNRFRKGMEQGMSHVWADPAQPQNIVTMEKEGIPTMKADNNVSAGLDLLLALFQPVGSSTPGGATPSLYIHESCGQLRRELASYQWGSNGAPVKENDHAVDALRYAVYSEMKYGALLDRKTKDLRVTFPYLWD